VGNGESYGAVFFAGFLAPSSLPALIRQIGKLAKDYPTREKLKKCLSMRSIRQHRCRVNDLLNCQLLLHNPLRWIQLIVCSNSSKWHTPERNSSVLTLGTLIP
jgi:hypothetical protein